MPVSSSRLLAGSGTAFGVKVRLTEYRPTSNSSAVVATMCAK